MSQYVAKVILSPPPQGSHSCGYSTLLGDSVSLPCLFNNMTSETVEVARIALRLQPFWKSNVRLWIAQCDHAIHIQWYLHHLHAVLSQPWTLSPKGRQIKSCLYKVAEPTRGGADSTLATNDIVLTAGDRIHALGVSAGEVASATIIAVIKSRPARVCFTLCILCKTDKALYHSWNGRPLTATTSRLFLLDHQIWPEIPHRLWK
ncbi:hypothetical protein TNCV_3574701 [Trichonephila clavipes]|nr:hypothetical protein TNCV_3574701 [Trichonephila clavipes]